VPGKEHSGALIISRKPAANGAFQIIDSSKESKKRCRKHLCFEDVVFLLGYSGLDNTWVMFTILPYTQPLFHLSRY
jgi:hypothetical protein